LRKIAALATFSVAVILSTCATPIRYDRTSAGNVRTIGLVTPVFPDNAQVVLVNPPNFLGLYDRILQRRRDSAFNELLEIHDFVVGDAFLERVTANLESDGYAVTLIKAERPGIYFLNTYSSETPVDAYLDILVFNYGYYAAGYRDSSPYRPAFALVVKLVRSSDYAVLMQDSIAYNPYGPPYGPNQANVTITPVPEFDFMNFDALEADPARAVQGIQDATFKTAEALSNLMR